MDETENDEMAAIMGFSSFGGTKRKHDQTNSPKSKADASGANATRLGVRSKVEHKLDNSMESDIGAVDPEASVNVVEPREASTKSQTPDKQPAPMGLAAYLSRSQSLPEKPAEEKKASTASGQDESESYASMVSFGGPAITRAELSALRHGVLDENGDKAYFLPSFVENPWKDME